jgi:hypothetical protein
MYLDEYVNWLKKTTDNIRIIPGTSGKLNTIRVRMEKNKEYFGYHDVMLSGSELDVFYSMFPSQKKDGSFTTKLIGV